MKLFVVIQNGGAHRVNWRNLYDPANHSLALITDKNSYDAISNKDQLKYFDCHQYLPNPTYENIYVVVKEVINKISKEKEIKETRIVTNGEFDLINCSKLRHAFGLEGDSENVITPFRDKLKMKEQLRNVPDALPKYLEFDPQAYAIRSDYLDFVINCLGNKIFAKPIDSAGSQNVSIINTKSELATWCEENKNNPITFELDEFIEGELYHCDSIIKENTLVFVKVSKYLSPCADFLKKPSASIIVPEWHIEFKRMLDFNKKILQQFDRVPDGTTHLEFFKTSDGRYIFCEVAARAPGIIIPQMYQKQVGFDYRELHYRLQMGLPITVNFSLVNEIYCACVCFTSIPGKITAFNQPSHSFHSQYEIITNHKIGEILPPPKRSSDFPIGMIFWNNNYLELLDDFAALAEMKLFEVMVDPVQIESKSLITSRCIEEKLRNFVVKDFVVAEIDDSKELVDLIKNTIISEIRFSNYTTDTNSLLNLSKKLKEEENRKFKLYEYLNRDNLNQRLLFGIIETLLRYIKSSISDRFIVQVDSKQHTINFSQLMTHFNILSLSFYSYPFELYKETSLTNEIIEYKLLKRFLIDITMQMIFLYSKSKVVGSRKESIENTIENMCRRMIVYVCYYKRNSNKLDDFIRDFNLKCFSRKRKKTTTSSELTTKDYLLSRLLFNPISRGDHKKKNSKTKNIRSWSQTAIIAGVGLSGLYIGYNIFVKSRQSGQISCLSDQPNSGIRFDR